MRLSASEKFNQRYTWTDQPCLTVGFLGEAQWQNHDTNGSIEVGALCTLV